MNPSFEQMRSASLINCHALGLDSIVVKKAPGMVRVFIARPEHNLHENAPRPDNPLGLGIHAHHCDVTLVPLFGSVYNIVADAGAGFPRELKAFHYNSQVTSTGAFLDMGCTTRVTLKRNFLDAPTYMPANMRHTILVRRGETAAWMVCEGKENPEHLPITWSDADLTKFDFSAYYQPMTDDRLRENLDILAQNGISL